MGLRFRQSFKLFPGVRLNMGKNGFSASFGGRGATVNVSRRGVRATVGLPGSGISYSHDLYKFNNGQGGHAPQNMRYIDPAVANYYEPPTEGVNVIRSTTVETLTSESLKPLRELIITATAQQKEIREDLRDARAEEASQRSTLLKRRNSIFRFFYKRRIAELEASLPVVSAEVLRLEEWEENTKIKIQFDVSEQCQYVYGEVVQAFEVLRQCNRIWDITSFSPVDQFRERSTADRTVYRKPVRFDFVSNDLIQFEGKAMRFENANGEDILIYPGIALIQRADGVFALVDLRELDITGSTTRFIESETVPGDSEVVDQTWAKTNKDGSPDRRFRENYQIPVCKYGVLNFRSGTGICEQYHLSQSKPANYFGAVFSMYQEALERESQNTTSMIE